MNRIKLVLYIGIVLSYFACSSEAPPSKDRTTVGEEKIGPSPSGQIQPSETTLLLFKAEKKLELWINGTRQAVYRLQLDFDFPIGQFSIRSVNKEALTIDFPNAYYLAKTKAGNDLPHQPIVIPNKKVEGKNSLSELAERIPTGSVIYIFPNDSRLTGDLIPCFGCPHWMAEQYSYLSLILKKYAN